MKDFKTLREQRNAANEKIGDIYMNAKNRELTDTEKMEVENLTREIEQCETDMRGINLDYANQAAMRERKNADMKQAFREMIQSSKDKGNKREILLTAGNNSSGTSNVKGNITASGAIELTINEMIPTLHEGLGLPPTLNIVTGVTGNELWPVSINDVEMEEVGEVEALNDQILEFEKITPAPKRLGLKVPVSNMAIDNAAFDLLAFVQTKFTIALKKYLAKKIYSQAAWDGNHGPFKSLTPAGTITIGPNAYKQILKAVAEFSDKGFFEGNAVIVMDRETEAELKATPKVSGAAAGFVIENGLCAGYPYVVTHYINTELSGSSLVPTQNKVIGIGYFEFLAVQQHGDVRMVIDPITVADRNVTRVILNTAWSITDLSVYINGGTPVTGDTTTYPTQAFALYTVAETSGTI